MVVSANAENHDAACVQARRNGTAPSCVNAVTDIAVGDMLNLNGSSLLLDTASLKKAISIGKWRPHTYPYSSDLTVTPSTRWGLNRNAIASGPDLSLWYWQRTNNELAAMPTADAFRNLGTMPLSVNSAGNIEAHVRKPTAVEAASMSPSRGNGLVGVPLVGTTLTIAGGIKPPFMFRMTARLPSQRGLWSAIWLLPNDGSWPPEIAIMEAVNPIGTSVTVTATIRDASNHTTGTALASPPGKNPTSSFIDYAGVIYPDRVAIFYDGKCVASWPMFSGGNISWYGLVDLTASNGGWAGTADPDEIFDPLEISAIELREMPAAYGGAASASLGKRSTPAKP